ncbi:snare associated Golgi protein-domain-containing protein [Halteromyces radiatus]|uniref:snare associated Golgi protein-domain-containing protein n=1 Tax=Halteromyces radiatus TaxID=101107 RepID=UPI002220AC0B|nr:snare associated Golgi protein-domain-containing protein [Halteromyces radiatus]KAI8078693.1 snare associated Golgi protein-domain-containing protein [Halteromyces radiatus]
MTEITSPLIAPNRTVLQPSYSTITQRPEQESEQHHKDDEQEELGLVGKPISNSTFTLWQSKSYLSSLVALILLLITFTALEFALLKLNLPSVDEEDRDALKFPRNLEDLRQLNRILSVYMDKHFINVYVTFVATYIYLQSFSIPGSMWLSILGGTLFDFWLTLFTVSMCSAVGATLAYIISGSLGSKAVIHLIGDRIASWNEQLVRHKKHMLNYLIVLRIAPFPPNWTINLGAPHLGVPLSSFFWGTFIGVTPPSFIHVQAGAAIDRLSSSDKLVILTPINVACLIGIAIAALIPVIIRRYYPL